MDNLFWERYFSYHFLEDPTLVIPVLARRSASARRRVNGNPESGLTQRA
jgi:hypothetical protein